MRKLIAGSIALAVCGFVIGALAIGAVRPPTSIADGPEPSPPADVPAVRPLERSYDAPAPAPGVSPGTAGFNNSGQDYGPLDGVDQPTLVEAIATNGQIGYVYAQDLIGPQVEGPMTPEKAATTQSAGRMIPVYLQDGVTQIGEFRVGLAIENGAR